MNEDELYSFAAKKRPGHACTPLADPNLRKCGQMVLVSQCFLLTMALLLQFEKPKSVGSIVYVRVKGCVLSCYVEEGI